MSEHNELTGSAQRRYTERMSEGGVGVAEQRPKSAEEELRTFEQMNREKIARERAERRDRRIEVGIGGLKESEKKEVQVPDIVLRKSVDGEGKIDWTELGWPPEAVTRVEAALQVRLGI